MSNRFLIGATYYPEHWPAENHPRDLDRMAAAGFNVVRLGEGAWWYWEPEEGKYQFELFDRVIRLCAERDIKVIMGTPTYTGPAWIMHKYPEVLRMNFDRVPMAHGSRQNFNHTSPKSRDLSRKVTAALANHYKDESQIIAWQLDNEINNGLDASYAKSDTLAFRAWLQKKYGTLDALNHAWGTRFWSQVYSDWDQVDLPSAVAQGTNPHRLLDQSRFVSDSVVEFLREQADILKKANPAWLVTHNSFFGNIHPRDIARQLDFFGLDHYPLFLKHWCDYAQKTMEARSYTFPYSVMEQQSGPGGQMSYLLRTPEPGEIRLWTYQSVAHGADRLLYFTWRTCPFGTEQHWHGLIDQDGKDNRRLREATQTASELAELPDDFFDSKPVKVAAVLRDFDNEVNEQRINTYTHDGRWAHGRWAASLMKRHVPVDFVWSDDELEGYSVLFAGHLKIVDDALVQKLKRFVEMGGTLVLGAQSGLHDRNLHIDQQTPPGLLAELAGVEVEDWTTLEKGQTRRLVFVENGMSVDAFAFAECLRPSTASPVAHWAEDRLLGRAPAVTARRAGRGEVVYIGAYLTPQGTDEVVDELIRRFSGEPRPRMSPLVKASPEVECVCREGKRSYFVLLNHGQTAATVEGLPSDAHTLIGPSLNAGTVELPSNGVVVIESELPKRLQKSRHKSETATAQ